MRLRLAFIVPSFSPTGCAGTRGGFAKFACWSLAALFPVCAEAQLSQTTTAIGDAPVLNTYAVTELGPNHQIWQSVIPQTNVSGDITYQTNSFTEMATGMHHLVNGQWVDSSEAIQITADGAVANNCQHQVAFTANINTIGAIDVTMPDGNHLKSQILGLSYLDPTTSQFVLIANLKDSTGQVTGALNNQVVYADAFDGGFKADVVYRNTKAGIEQNILLKEQLPSPVAFGLNPANTRLQVMTEFLNPPTAQVTQATAFDGTTVDQMIEFGQMCIGQGQAFSVESDLTTTPGGIPMNGFPVNKHWLLVNSRQILVEDVPFPMIAPQLQELPAPSIGSSTNKGADAGGLLHRVFAQLRLPPAPKLAKPSGATMKYATLPSAERGFVLDYSAVASTTTNVVFKSDTTYYISGPVNLYGTTTIEGGTVIKLTNAPANPVSVNVNGGLQYLTAPYRPAIFTSEQDDSVGEKMPWSTNNPTVLTYSTELYWPSGSNVSNVRFAYAWNAFAGATADQEIWDCQFVKCSHPLSPQSTTTTMGLHNVLITMDDSMNNSTNPCSCPPAALTVYSTVLRFYGENVTANLGSQYFAIYYTGSTPSNTTYSLTNSIIIATNLNPVYRFGLATNGIVVGTNSVFYASTKPGALFQAVGGGNYYLADNTYRNLGATNISAALLADLQQKTTYPPVLYSNVAFSAATTLFPQAQRDVDIPDIGYHYDPIDWLFTRDSASAPVTMTPGTAIAWLPNAVWPGLTANAGMTVNGTVTAPDNLVCANTVQESCGSRYNQGILIYSAFTGSFARFSMLAGADSIFLNGSGFSANNCEFWFSPLYVQGGSLIFTNCLFQRESEFALSGAGPTFTMQNCTAIGGGWSLTAPSSPATWTVKDTAFDTPTNLSFNPGTTATTNFQNNAYITGQTQLGSVSNYTTTNFNWQKGALGNYYIATTNINVDHGSTTANLVGLYHFTTQTNQMKETNSVVDIGYHYVALGTNGLPMSTGGDGIGDYLVDANGNGTNDAGDLGNWTNYTSPNNLAAAPGLIVFTPLH
jgi:hypothetical protein